MVTVIFVIREIGTVIAQEVAGEKGGVGDGVGVALGEQGLATVETAVKGDAIDEGEAGAAIAARSWFVNTRRHEDFVIGQGGGEGVLEIGKSIGPTGAVIDAAGGGIDEDDIAMQLAHEGEVEHQGDRGRASRPVSTELHNREISAKPARRQEEVLFARTEKCNR